MLIVLIVLFNVFVFTLGASGRASHDVKLFCSSPTGA
jgi:hypothetical protein